MHHFKQRNVRIALCIFAIVFLIVLFFNSWLAEFLLSYIILYKYVTLFIIVFLAGLILPLPMNILLMGVGAFSVDGYFNFNTSLVVATIANSAGNMVAHGFFTRYGHDILRDKYVQKYPFFLRLEDFFCSHTNISIFMSRIVGIFGTPVNFLSGYFKVSLLRFSVFDVLGNITFSFLFLKMGYIVGDKWATISKFVGTFLSVFSVLIFILVFLFIFYRKKKINSIS